MTNKERGISCWVSPGRFCLLGGGVGAGRWRPTDPPRFWRGDQVDDMHGLVAQLV